MTRKRYRIQNWLRRLSQLMGLSRRGVAQHPKNPDSANCSIVLAARKRLRPSGPGARNQRRTKRRIKVRIQRRAKVSLHRVTATRKQAWKTAHLGQNSPRVEGADEDDVLQRAQQTL